MKKPKRVFCLPMMMMALFFLPVIANATPYIPLEQADDEANLRASITPEGPQRVLLDDLDELGYVYHWEYFQLINQLTTMQVTEAGPDFGGMREGEQDLDIIQTDNTQECLRDWARYGFITGDTARFRQNIEDAWTYTLNWPAYLEEGGANPNYYRVHNCGWGLMAYMEYANTYGENLTYQAYADSCARYIDHWRLSWSGVGIELNPLVAGYGAGTLYLYGVWSDNQDWRDAAQEIATEVKEWIETNPNRLNANESWAMSGGTAMWGVVTALYLDDPTAGAIWIPTVSDHMDTYSGPGQWNNSWTVWYGHAWNAIHQVLGDDESYNNMLEVVDFLLDQDEIDDDGIIPATEGHHHNDQSWTSAYLGWYGLEYILHLDGDDYDAIAKDVYVPVQGWELWQNETVGPFVVGVANGGMMPLEGEHSMTVSIYAEDELITLIDNLDIPFGMEAEVITSTGYTPTEVGDVDLRLIVTTLNDEDTSNDTLDVVYTVVPIFEVTGSVRADGENRGLTSTLIWTLNDTEPIRTDTIRTQDGGSFSFSLATGEYTFEFIPDETPYPPRKQVITVPEGGISDLALFSPRLNVLYVSEPGDTLWDNLMLHTFEDLNNEAYYWSIPEKGRPNDNLNTVSSVFWATGDEGEILAEESQSLYIQQFLENGGSFLLSGTNAMDVMGGTTFYQNYFGVNDGNHNLQGALYHGAEDFPITQGESMVINLPFAQNLPDGMTTMEGGIPLFTNAFTNDTMGVAFIHPEDEFRSILLGFGAELIMTATSGQYLELETFLGRCLEWFGHSAGVDDPFNSETLPDVWSLNTWPNPFNPTVNIGIHVPQGQAATLQLFDILGRRVAKWERISSSGQTVLQWNGERHSSGVYFLHMDTGTEVLSKKVILLR